MYTSRVFHSFCSLVSHFALLLVLELGLLLSMIVVIGSGSAASAVATSSAIMTELFDSVGLRLYIPSLLFGSGPLSFISRFRGFLFVFVFSSWRGRARSMLLSLDGMASTTAKI